MRENIKICKIKEKKQTVKKNIKFLLKRLKLFYNF